MFWCLHSSRADGKFIQIVVNLGKFIELVYGIQSRMTADWIKQSPGLYRATKRKGVAPSLQVDGATRKTNTRDCKRWCNQEEYSQGVAL